MFKSIQFFLLLLFTSIPVYSYNWMRQLPDDQYVSTVSIPGAHDAATGSGWAAGSTLGETYSTTQDLTISQMWEIGIRAFDFRPALYDGYMNLNHGITATKIKFDDVMYQLRDSLLANPSEFVIIHLLHASDGDNVDDDYGSRLHQLFDSDELKDFLSPFKYNLTVGDLRGKMLILSRDSYTNPVGGIFQNWTGSVDWNSQQNGRITGKNGSGSCIMQDYSETWQEGAMETKLSAMTKLLDYSVWHKTNSPTDIKWIFNFASAYSKVMSLFGYNISLSSGYRDNASHTNPLIIDYLSNQTGPTGIIMMDYVGVANSNGYMVRGDEAVQMIIENNFKEHTNKYVLQNSFPSYLQCGIPGVADYNNNNTLDFYYGGFNDSDSVCGVLYSQAANGTYSVEVSNIDDKFKAHGLPPFAGGFPKWLDYDNDGCLDIVLTTRDTIQENTFVYHNLGNGANYQFEINDSVMLLKGDVKGDVMSPFNTSSVSFSDYDRDGYTDIVQQYYTQDCCKSVIFHNNDGVSFSKAVDLEDLAFGAVVFGDLDNDGYPDVVQTGYNEISEDGSLYIYKNNGDGTFKSINMNNNGLIGYYENDICLTDINGDGLLDLILCGMCSDGTTHLYINNGNFSFSMVEDSGIPNVKQPLIRSFDINYDGKTDVMITGKYDLNEEIETRFYLQKKDGTFELMNGAGVLSQTNGGVAIGDISKRNTMDLVSVSGSGTYIYRLFEEPTRKPDRPSGVKCSVEGRSITVTWNEAKETGIDSKQLSYNVYVKDADTDATFMLIPANTSTGRLRTIQDMQNTIHGNSFSITPSKGRNFVIGVQTIDPSFVTSTFSRVNVSINERIHGDVNEDGIVNINDVVAVINQMAGIATWQYADVNNDNMININDVVSIINIMAGI